MIRVLAHAPNSVTGEFELAGAAESAGIEVVRIAADDLVGVDVAQLARVAGDGVAYRCATGPLTRALLAGAPVRLRGATPEWFVGLPSEITGRRWQLVRVPQALSALADAPAFVKLADGKFRALPARRYHDAETLEAALAAVHAPDELGLLLTHDWLPIDSEYRTFTVDRAVVACSPYLVHNDPWTPLLHTHRASFHDEAARFVHDVLAALPDAEVPPTAVLDVARLKTGGFVLLEVNHVWSAGLYGCDPTRVLPAVLRAADQHPLASGDRWRWQPDAAVDALHR